MSGLMSALGGGSFLNKTSKERARCYLTMVDPDGKINQNEVFAFQYYPASISDTKTVEWSSQDIPGGSLPVYQWVSSGARTITFTATLSCDMDLLASDTDFADLKSKGLDDRNVDIRSAVVWLRRYLLPAYGPKGAAGTPMTFAPPVGFLQFTNLSSMGLGGGESSATSITNAGLYVIMTRCDVEYKAFFTSGLPRLAELQFDFVQTMQYGPGTLDFPSRGTADATGKVAAGQMSTAAKDGSGKSYYSYTLRGPKR